MSYGPVSVELSPDYAWFRQGDHEVRWATTVRVAPRTGWWGRRLFGPVALLGIGADLRTAPGHEIKLFDARTIPDDLVHEQCLEVCFRYSLNTLTATNNFRVKPKVVVSGMQTVAGGIKGDAKQIVRRALLTAGASAVVWQD